MNTLFTRYIGVLLLLINTSLFAQQTPTPPAPNLPEEPIPKEQPLDKPTVLKDKSLPDAPLLPNNPPATNLAAGGLPLGQTPVAPPESNFINRFQDIPINLFTGTPIIGLPIYTLSEAGGASVPIALSYNASGMKGHDVASWTGMNWLLVSGGQITRITRGLPDEGKFTLDNNLIQTARKGAYQHGVYADNDSENDPQYDIFLLNINGTSYKFSFDSNRKAHFFPETDIDVSVTWSAIDNSTVGFFSNWIVTMPDGTKYYFDGPTAFESSFELEATQAKNISNYNFGVYRRYEEVVSAFYLTKIETAFGHQTLFEYKSTLYSFFRIAEQAATTFNCTFSGIDKYINKVYVASSALYKISNGTHVVEFNKGGWSQGTNEFGMPYWYLNNTYPARQDIDEFAKTPSNTSSARALHKITVYAKDDPSKVYNWNFTYDYNTGVDPSNIPPFNYSYETVGHTHKKRFKLRSVQEPDGNQYTFKYYDDTYPLPSRFTQGIDHWGYLNGVLSANLLIGQDAFRNCANGQAANRSATVGWSQYGTLTAISHSTGGSSILEYENHTANNYASIIGGSRIKKVTYIDSVSFLKTVKRYDYQLDNGNSSGFLCLKPVYHFDDKVNYQGAPNQYWYSGLYQQLLSESGRPAVGYSRVKETILNSTEDDNLGYTVSTFLQPLTEINIQEIVTYNCQTRYPPEVPYPITTCDTSRYLRPWKWNPYHENTIGAPASVSVYSKNNILLSEKNSVYGEVQRLQTPPYQFNYHSFRFVNKNYNFERAYYEFYYYYRLISETSKIFSQDGTNPVVSSTTYSYKDETDNTYQQAYPGKHNQVVKTTTSDSYGNIIEHWTKYAADFVFSPLPSNNIEEKGIRALQNKHILNGVIESITRKQNLVDNNFVWAVINASYQTFYDKDSATFKAGLPRSSYVLENVPRSSFTEVNYNTSTQTFARSNEYDLKNTIEAYTATGLPIQSSTRFGTKNKTIYHSTYTSLPISQITNWGQASQQTTNTEYANILYGVSKQIGVNELSITNEYYLDGKLKLQKDKDGNIVRHIQYVYRGQQDTDPLLTTNSQYNRIITRIPRIASTNALALDHTQCSISVAYIDGSGRTLQHIDYKASPNQQDFVSGVIDYDIFARPKKTWLSVESTKSDGSLLDTSVVKATAKSFYKDPMPYAEVVEYEASPLSRVFKSYGTGKVFRDSSRYVQNRYETANAIKRFNLKYQDNAINIDTYSTYLLTKLTSTDEQGAKVIEYKDKAGNTIQREVQVSANSVLTTAYIYDNAGRLRYVLTPKAYNLLGNATHIPNIESWEVFDENVYAFHYDGRGRAIEKHSPSVGWSRLVYNRLDQAVLSQDDDEATRNIWNYTQTDGQGRTIRSGQFTLNASRNTLQGYFDNFTDANQFEERIAAGSYTNRSFPNILRDYINNTTIKTIAFFDDYNWRYDNQYSGSIADYDFQPNTFNSTAYSANTNKAKGLATGSLIKDEIYGDFFFPSVSYYDYKNQIIQTISYHNLLARNQADIQYNFVGDVLKNQMIYRKNGAIDYIRTTEQAFDHNGRLKDLFYTLKQGSTEKVARIKMASYFYDAIGRLKTKAIQPSATTLGSKQSGLWTQTSTWLLGAVPTISDNVIINQGHVVTIPSTQIAKAGSLFDKGNLVFQPNSQLQLGSLQPNNTGSALQLIEYSYNIRNQLRGINLDDSDNLLTSQDKLFSYKLDYHETNRYYDGSIAKQTWKSAGVSSPTRSFTYTYDLANRLTNASFASNKANENYSLGNISYDVMGNLQTMQRYSKTGTTTWGLVDNLSYTYLNNGNRLQKIDDSIAGNIPANDFRDITGNDYTYYPDGKLKTDTNKGITNIEYNFLDLIKKVTFGNGTEVEYFYTSTGNRIQRKITKNNLATYTIYNGEIVYSYSGNNPTLQNFDIDEIQHPEGRFVDGKLEYAYTDYLANLRLSYQDSLGIAKITQEQSYDPWSNVLAGTQYYDNPSKQDYYLVAGKPYQNETALTSLDWREYDATIGRMNNPDPEDQFQHISPFAYCANNPVSHIDPDGRFLHIGIGAVLGGAINLGIKAYQGKIKNWTDGAAAFGIGALAGGLGAATGGAAFAATGGATAGAGGFVAGAIGGLAGSAASSPIQGFGNAAYFHDSYAISDFGRDLLIGGAMGGVINGAIAGFNGKNFWSGSPRSMGSHGIFSFNNQKALTQEGWTKLSNGKWFRAESDNVIYGPVEKQLADGSMAWSDDFAGHRTGDVYGGRQSSWIEGTHKSSLNTMIEGRYAVESIEGNATRNFATIRDQINEIGRKYGCHTCGTKTANGIYIPDHQPPLKLSPKGPFKLFPHCPNCSKLQGGQVNKYLNH
ncbi:DUF6443 domain-containing protein [Flectobacillus major]|uniref:DUF6443 domain-containing protein n=1 Tax=Flectobacillus major TaxID=103 RepID=UPI0004128297|nr:DUF6443 domain-containing protein [Flectobacillus major]